MPRSSPRSYDEPTLSDRLQSWRRLTVHRLGGGAMVALGIWFSVALATHSVSDPSFNTATPAPVANWAGAFGAKAADFFLQMFGGAAMLVIAPLMIWGVSAVVRGAPDKTTREAWFRFALFPAALLAAAGFAAALPAPATWPFAVSVGGVIGDQLYGGLNGLWASILPSPAPLLPRLLAGGIFLGLAFAFYPIVCGLTGPRFAAAARTLGVSSQALTAFAEDKIAAWRAPLEREEPALEGEEEYEEEYEYEEVAEEAAPDTFFEEEVDEQESSTKRKIIREKPGKKKESKREARERQPELPVFTPGSYQLPPLNLLAKPKPGHRLQVSDEALEQNARMLETVLADFGVRGEIINVRPGPVVTLYELEPAAGVKSSRVIGLADDIARSMSAVAARVAVVPGRNAIGIELPNQDREMVYVRELLGSSEYEKSRGDLTLSLGVSIGGEPVYADLARMPHLLIAGTTGSGKSVGINTMIVSLLYRLPPDACKLIMIDPKMLELSVYEGIPHLLSPVVTDPRKAVVALKWTVREMEERYQRMSKVGVRNIAGFNQKVLEAAENNDVLSRTVHTGYDEETGEPVYETEEFDFEPMPFIVVVIDEVADLMMVAGKDIEGMVQRLAQMARAAGIHLIMATQRPSVDVITGTIKANFPTRISFQVTSKIDSRTILGEQGAEQLLGQGDMLYMAGGGRIKRVHGGFIADDEVESIVKFLKKQGAPEYVQEVTEMKDEDGGDFGLDIGGNTSSGDALYDKAVAIVLRDRKASTSYIQRRLQIGYNRAATLIEQMEEEGVISSANHAGKRQILVGEDAA